MILPDNSEKYVAFEKLSSYIYHQLQKNTLTFL